MFKLSVSAQDMNEALWRGSHIANSSGTTLVSQSQHQSRHSPVASPFDCSTPPVPCPSCQFPTPPIYFLQPSLQLLPHSRRRTPCDVGPDCAGARRACAAARPSTQIHQPADPTDPLGNQNTFGVSWPTGCWCGRRMEPFSTELSLGLFPAPPPASGGP